MEFAFVLHPTGNKQHDESTNQITIMFPATINY